MNIGFKVSSFGTARGSFCFDVEEVVLVLAPRLSLAMIFLRARTSFDLTTHVLISVYFRGQSHYNLVFVFRL